MNNKEKNIVLIGLTGCGTVSYTHLDVYKRQDHMDEYIKIAYMKIINNARKYVYIQTPYLVPDEPILEALRISALSGVDVRIIVPDKPDHFFMEWVLSANIANLIDYGVKIYRYNNGFIHSKTIVSDDIVSSIGTANMDNSCLLYTSIQVLLYRL